MKKKELRISLTLEQIESITKFMKIVKRKNKYVELYVVTEVIIDPWDIIRSDNTIVFGALFTENENESEIVRKWINKWAKSIWKNARVIK